MAEARNEDIDIYTRQVVLVILHIMRNLRISGMDLFTEIELSYPQSLLLYSLLETGPVTMSELSNNLKITQGVVSRMTERLVEKELVQRERDKSDRRVVHVSLTENGREYTERMITVHLEKIRNQFQKVDKDTRETFLKLLLQIDEQLEE